MPCVASTVSLLDNSLYNPTSWEWLFEPSTVTFLKGTSASSQNPEVKFTASGDYSLLHNVWNANGLASKSYVNLIHVIGAVPDYNLNMEDGTSGYCVLWDTIKLQAKVDARAANNSNYRIHFKGSPLPIGWQGSPTSTTASQAWTDNRRFQAESHICGVEASGITYVVLSLDLRQTYSIGPRLSWFRVLVNGIQISEDHGVMDFNPSSMADDSWNRLYFDLSPFIGSVFDITLQASCRFSDKKVGEGDNVFIDNISIVNTTITGIKESGISEFSVYPNPSDGTLRISVNPISGKAVIKVTSMIGNTLYTKNIYPKDNRTIQEMDLTFLPAGVYQISISDFDKQFNQRIVIR